MQLLEPWMQARLPKVVDPTARAHIIQLAAGIFERQSALVATIATASAFQANTDSSNETLLRRILRDERLFLESVYYPFIQHLLNEMAPSELYLTIKGYRPVVWYLASSLPTTQERFIEYACRWWQECGWKGIKSGLFDWERGRIVDFERVRVLLIGISCALWALWLLGRAHEHLPVLKPTTTTPQPRRKSIIQDGISAFTNASKHGQVLSFTTPPKPRVLDYLRTFAPLAKVDIMQ